jgi:hypothetical protein
MLPFDERENILKSMEKHNFELTKAFKKFRQIKNIDVPEIDDDGKIDTETQNILVELYNTHKTLLHNILKCAGTLKEDIEDIEDYFERGKEKQEELKRKLNERPKEYTQENIRDVFYNLLNPFVLGVSLIGGGNSLEKNDLVSNFKINDGIIHGDTLDIDNNVYSSSIDMNLFQYKQIITKKLKENNINLENILNILNESKIKIIPEDFYKLKCKCSCNNIEQPCKHNIALYFRFIDNIKMNKYIVIELFGIK